MQLLPLSSLWSCPERSRSRVVTEQTSWFFEARVDSLLVCSKWKSPTTPISRTPRKFSGNCLITWCFWSRPTILRQLLESLRVTPTGMSVRWIPFRLRLLSSSSSSSSSSSPMCTPLRDMDDIEPVTPVVPQSSKPTKKDSPPRSPAQSKGHNVFQPTKKMKEENPLMSQSLHHGNCLSHGNSNLMTPIFGECLSLYLTRCIRRAMVQNPAFIAMLRRWVLPFVGSDGAR